MIEESINMENYEIYLMDYFDGQLSEDEVDALMLFLESHPEIKSEMDGFEEIRMTPEEVHLDYNILKKNPIEKPETFINTENAEEYFIAYLEGDLNDSQKEELRVFVEEEIELKKEFEFTQRLTLQPNINIEYKDKEMLYLLAADEQENIDRSNFEEYCVAYYEGDLDENQMASLNKYISDNEELKVVFESYAKLNMEADLSVIFTNKDSLKHRSAFIKFNRFSYSSIASIAAIFLFLFLYPSLLNNSKTELLLNRHQRKSIKKVALVKNSPKNVLVAAAVDKTASISKPLSKRDHSLIAKVSIMRPQFLNVKADNNFAERRPIIYNPPIMNEGYYEVSLVETNFRSKNPDLVKRIVKGVRNLLNISAKDLDVPEDRLTLWDVADAGLKGFNAMTENRISLSRR